MDDVTLTVRELTPSKCCSVLFCGVSCDTCLLTVFLIAQMTSLKVECKTKNKTGIEEVHVLFSADVSTADFPSAELLKKPLTEQRLREIQTVLLPSDLEMDAQSEATKKNETTSDQPPSVFRLRSSSFRTLANENQNCTSTARSNCTNGTRTEESNEKSGSASISWQVLLVILLVCIPVCFILGCLAYRFILSSNPDSRNESAVQTPPPRQVTDRGLPGRGPTDHVVRWLEDPVRHQPHDPVPLVPEELHAYRIYMIQRAQVYGYNPLHVPIRQIQLGGFNPYESPLSWQLSSS